MRILITNGTLRRRSGTECYAIELGAGLRDRGHEVVFFSPRLGATAQELVASGFPVTDRLSEIGTPPDIIHGQHTVPALRAACAFPDAPLLYICHDALSPSDSPTPAFLTDQYAAVDHLTRRRIIEEVGVFEADVALWGNSVDPGRFQCRGTFSESPKRALIYSGSTRSVEHFQKIRAVCRQLSLPLDEAGERADGFFDRPEDQLLDYDIVFCKARCAMEAMATGAFVILIGDSGMGPALDLSNVSDLRCLNFGREALTFECTDDLIEKQIGAYDADTASALAEWTRNHLSPGVWLDKVEADYREVLGLGSARASLSCLPDGNQTSYRGWELRYDAKARRFRCVEEGRLGRLKKSVRDESLRFWQRVQASFKRS